MTKREMYTQAIEIISFSNPSNGKTYDRPAIVEGLSHEIELLDRKASQSSSAALKRKSQNAGIADMVITVLANADHPMTVSELQGEEPLTQFTSQKLTSILYQLLDEGRAVRTFEKRKSYFSIAPTEG